MADQTVRVANWPDSSVARVGLEVAYAIERKETPPTGEAYRKYFLDLLTESVQAAQGSRYVG